MEQPGDTARARYRAVLFDFGGVLTTSVLASLAEFGRQLGDPRLVLRVLAEDEGGRALLKAHEIGEIDQAAFEQGMAKRLQAHGAHVGADGLLARMQTGLEADPATVALVGSLRDRGVPVGLLSNSLGDDGYAGFDLPAMFDAVTISGEIGVRKPSRGAYRIACERLGTAPDQTIMVDDLEQNLRAAERLGMGAVLHRDAVDTAAQLGELLDLELPTRAMRSGA